MDIDAEIRRLNRKFIADIAEFVRQRPAVCGTTEEEIETAVGDIVAAILDGAALAADGAVIDEAAKLGTLRPEWKR
jgi:hypothetical protein